MKRQNLLKQAIADHALPLGSTPAGSIWSTKALHPADLDIPSQGLPDFKSGPTAVLNFGAKFKIVPPTQVGTDQTWNADILFQPSLTNFGRYYADSVTAAPEPLVNPVLMSSARSLNNTSENFTFFPNAQIPGAGAYIEDRNLARTTFIQSNCRMFRPIYAGMTVTFDAPQLSDQGMISSVQYPYVPGKLSSAGSFYQAAQAYAAPAVKSYSNVFPTFDQLQNLPTVKTTKATEGCYVPFKFSEHDFHWKNAQELVFNHNNPGAGILDLTPPTGKDNPIHPVEDVCIGTYPFTLHASSTNLSHTAIRGISFASSMYVQFRVGYELMVSPGSIYSPYLTPPTLADPSAMSAYFAISRMLADSYPESYNSLGLLLTTIASVANAVLPHVVPVITGVGNAVLDHFRNKEKNKEEHRMKAIEGAAQDNDYIEAQRRQIDSLKSIIRNSERPPHAATIKLRAQMGRSGAGASRKIIFRKR